MHSTAFAAVYPVSTFDAIRRWSHIDELDSLDDLLLFQPLMPLGVDHGFLLLGAGFGVFLFQPLMPLGVDHGDGFLLLIFYWYQIYLYL